MTKSWQREDNSDVFIKIITFLISPFLSFLYSLIRIKTKSSFVVFFLFALFFGMALTTSEGADAQHSNDSAIYRQMFVMVQGTTFSEFVDYCKDIISGDDNMHKDLYFYVIAYFVSTITDNYHVLFFVLAFVFGYFMLRSLAMLINEPKYVHCLPAIILLYLFTYNGIFNINGVRFWTAAWIAVYALLQILVNDNKKYYILLALTPMVHLSYLVLLVIVGAYLLIGKMVGKGWIVVFVLSFLLSGFSTFFIQYFLGFSMGATSMFEGYVQGGQLASSSASQVGMLENIFTVLSKFYIMIMFLRIYYATIQKGQVLQGAKLYKFVFLAYTVVNFLSPIPSLGNRFFILLYPLLVYLWIINFGTKKYNVFLMILPIVFIYNIYRVSYGISVRLVDMSFFYTNPFSLIYKYLILGAQ